MTHLKINEVSIAGVILLQPLCEMQGFHRKLEFVWVLLDISLHGERGSV